MTGCNGNKLAYIVAKTVTGKTYDPASYYKCDHMRCPEEIQNKIDLKGYKEYTHAVISNLTIQAPERLPLALRGFFLPMGQNLQKISRNIG